MDTPSFPMRQVSPFFPTVSSVSPEFSFCCPGSEYTSQKTDRIGREVTKMTQHASLSAQYGDRGGLFIRPRQLFRADSQTVRLRYSSRRERAVLCSGAAERA